MKMKHETTDTSQLTKLELDSALPFADQVADHFRSLILEGSLGFGDELPSAKTFSDVSHVTVLQAYRRLAGEGYLDVRRAKRTRVAVNVQSRRYVLLGFSKEHRLYEDIFLSEFQQVAQFEGRNPEVFNLGATRNVQTFDEADRLMPAPLRAIINGGQLRACFLSMADRMPGLLEWMTRRRVPHVAFHPLSGVSHAIFDHVAIYADAIRLLASKGCRRVAVLPWHWERMPAEIQHLQRELPGLKWIEKRAFGYEKDAPFECGRRFARFLLEAGPDERPEALLVADDIVGLGAMLEIKERGLRIPRDIRLLVTSVETQILPAFSGCDLIITPASGLIQTALTLAEDVIAAKVPAGTARAAPYRIVPGE